MRSSALTGRGRRLAKKQTIVRDSEWGQKYLIFLTLFKYCPFAAAEAARKRQQEEGEERPEPRGHASLHDNGRNYAPRLRRDARQSDRANVLAVTKLEGNGLITQRATMTKPNLSLA